MKVYHHYNNDHLPNSAEIIVPYIMELLSPTSVIDIGCGLGQWLYVFKQNGVNKILGVDGKHVPKEKIMLKADEFFEFDLNNCENFSSQNKFNLAISLEVAEHLIEDKAHSFINMLTQLSNIIIFSAAIPGQMGENHFNEQFPQYWINLFANKGYSVLDPFRKKYWNSNVNWWYTQNMYLFIKNDISINLQKYIWDENVYIHPKLFEIYKKQQSQTK
ncbi:MAG: hypothetical protein DKM50_06790 [Candidatus Margulisiibacteriota bacterium]|nr:MAG: hypothetical protein DKM50_06790 [Candidatus Margulisiibacteriota bacterium]HCY35679.1 hypothetical protein [Candidatus Margulisiibacteriota bacterium]